MGFILASILALCLIFHQGTLIEAKELTGKEKTALDKFRPMVEKELYQPFMRTDEYLLWWIEDREFDLAAANAKLTKALKWRKTNEIDKILSEVNPFIDNYMKYDMTVKDSLGGPVVLVDFGSWDVRRVVLAGKLPELNRYMLKMMERGMTESFEIHKTKPEVSQWVILANYQGCSLRKQGCLACIPFFLEYISNYENYYTGSTRNIFAVNMPKVFDTIVNLARGAMSPGTQKGCKLYGTDKSEWDYLDKIIPRHQLPLRYGGTKR